jgi:hypothetical protein
LQGDDLQLMNVSAIEYCNLRFICNLVLEIWDFIVLLNFLMDLVYNLLLHYLSAAPLKPEAISP